MVKRIKRVAVGGRYYEVLWDDYRGFYYVVIDDEIVPVGANHQDGQRSLRQEIATDVQVYLDK